jgi:membrane protease YdiL (CAAX protease family)
MLGSSTVENERSQPIKLWPFGVGFLILAVLFGVGVAAGGELAQLMLAALQTLPFVVLALLAYLGIERMWAKVLALLWLGLIVLGLGGTTLLLSLATVPGFTNIQPGQTPEFSRQDGLNLLAIFIGNVVVTGVAALGFIPAVRRRLSRVLPIDPDSFVHMIALVTVVSCTLIALMPLLALGEPPLLTTVTNLQSQGRSLNEGQDEASQLRATFYVLIWQIPGAIIAVGYLIRRSLRGALERLGLVRPTLRQVLIGIGMALVLVVGATGLDWLINQVWSALGWARTDGDAFNDLMSFAINPLGAVVIGITAGLGEELSVRGVLQPRLGILLSNVFFTSLHGLQYNWDGLLSVFLIGLVLGLIRKRTNTTTSAITHGVYDFVLVLMTALNFSFF